MNQIDRNKLIKMVAILFLLVMAVGIVTQIHKKNSMTLDEYAKLHPELSAGSESDTATDATNESGILDVSGGDLSAGDPVFEDISGGDSIDTTAPVTTLVGALLNGGADGQAMLAERITYVNASGIVMEAFYCEPLSENLQRYITGISYPIVEGADNPDTEAANGQNKTDTPAVGYEDLRYIHILHYGFDGVSTEGELICNAAIAPDLLDIFYELYRNEYQLEKVRLIDEYAGDDTASMEDNNTSCFNYRVVEGTKNLSKHALGLALDINPFYNPYVTYEKDGSTRISPADAAPYADRTMSFSYKIDENDLCYKLFIEHGFTWGGNWNSSKDYQHFQKTP